MKEKYSGCFMRVLALALAIVLLMPFVPEAAQAASNGMVRVKLTRLGSNSSIAIKTNCEYYVLGKSSVRIPSGSSATITASGASVYLTANGTKIPMGDSLKLMRTKPGKYGVNFTSPSMSNLFCGDLQFTASSSILSVVLNIYIEDYLYGVVGYEMSPSNPIEALKAQAIAARNYALRQKSAGGSKAYDVVDTSTNQVFRGYNSASTYANVVKAVDATKGQTLYYGGSLAACYYGSSNGGQTESTKNAWGNSLAYSIVKDDMYDFESTGTTKSARIQKDASGLNASLKSMLTEGVVSYVKSAGIQTASADVSLDGIVDIEPMNPKYSAPSRLYKTLRFSVRATVKDATGERITGTAKVDIQTYDAFESWYSLSINSGSNETIWVEEESSAFVVSFRRNGHGIGMSQRGAQVMAKKYGMSCAQILDYYYPGTELKQGAYTDTTADDGGGVDYKVIATARAKGVVNLYATASTGSTILASLAKGTAIEVYAVNGTWAAVGSGGAYGFMQTSGLESFALVNTSVTAVTGEMYAQVTASSAALLELPVSGAEQLAKLSKGDYVQVYAYSSQWASVRTQRGVSGFMEISGLAVVQPTPSPTNGVVVPETEMYAKVALSSSSGSVTVRKSASTSAAKVTTLKNGTYVQILAYNSSWAMLLTRSGQKGFVQKRYLKLVSAEEANPTPTPTPTSNIVTPTEDMYARVKSASPVYKSASKSASQLAKLSKGAYVKVLAYSPTWVQVLTTQKVKGYMPISALQVVPAEEALATPTPAPASDVIKVKGTKYGYVITAATNLYKSNSTASGVIKQLPYSTRVQVGMYNSEWAYVKYGSTLGFILLSELSTKTTAAKNEKQVIVAEFYAKTTAKASVYKSASSKSKVIGKLSSGQKITVHAYNSKFAYISLGDNYGFVAIKYLKATV